MNAKPGITLEKARKSSKLASNSGVFQASDFMTEDEQLEVQMNNMLGKRQDMKFNSVDAFIGEMIARFGYETYRAWNDGELPEGWIDRLMLAERARERRQFIDLETIVIAMVGSCIRKDKGKPAPKGAKIALKVLKETLKEAKGVTNG